MTWFRSARICLAALFVAATCIPLNSCGGAGSGDQLILPTFAAVAVD